MLAELHPRQTERLNTLRELGILDTEAEEDFGEIAALASRICEAPISLISLVESDRQWFKARTGMDAPETGLEKSICSHVILQDEVVEITDTRLDPRTADNPLCLDTEPEPVRFYAGAPLIASDGLPVGALCVLDKTPRVLNDLQRETLRVLSRQVIRQMELRKALRDSEMLRREVDHRVKNSLQSVSSVVRLFSRQVTDPEAVEALGAIQRRIEAVGALHEQLQVSGDGDQVDLAGFLQRMAEHLQISTPENVSLSVRADPAVLPSDKVSAIGIIVSEFFTNSIKHAFPGRREGTVSIEFAAPPGGAMTLTCRDDGIGSAGPRKKARASGINGLGRDLLAAAASQAGGRLKSGRSASGSHLVLEF